MRHVRLLRQALADLIEDMDWKSFIIIYEGEESLVRLQEVIKAPKTFAGHRVSFWQLNPQSMDYRCAEMPKTQGFFKHLYCTFFSCNTPPGRC